MQPAYVVGKFTGTTLALYCCIGFIPAFVAGYNDGTACTWVWSRDNGAGKGQKITAAAAKVAANGISEFAGGTAAGTIYRNLDGTAITAGDPAPAGFAVGTDANINAAGSVYYVAFRGYAPQTP